MGRKGLWGMKMKSRLRFLVAALMLSSAATAMAHHSYAIFDATKKVTITGKVVRFDFINPHTWLVVLVKDPQTGNDVEWRLEGMEPNSLARHGWKRTSLQPGDAVSVLINPMRDGTPGGSFLEVTVNGAVLSVTR